MSKNIASHGSFYSFERNKCKSNWFCFPIFMVFRCLKMFMLLLSFLIYFQYFGSMMLKNCVALPCTCMNQYRSCLYWFNGSPATAAGLTSFNNVFFLHSSLNSGFLSFSWGNKYKLTKQVCFLSSARNKFSLHFYKFLISVAYFISSALFQLYIFVLVYLETFPFAHFINSALMEQIEL
jgi:hypothetical protein